MLILLPSETAGERRAELLQNGPVIRTCLSLLTLELFGASAVTAVGPLSPPPPKHSQSLVHFVIYSWFAVILRKVVEISKSKNLWCHQMWCNVVVSRSESLKLWHGARRQDVNRVSVGFWDFLSPLWSLLQPSVNRLRKSSNFRRPDGGWMHNISFPFQ